MSQPPQQAGTRRPAIGITPDFEAPRYELKAAYPDAVLRAGGLPMVLPYTEEAAAVDAYLDRISGLVVTGGHFDIPPEAYGEKPSEQLGPVKQGRTDFETRLLKGALDRRIPILGVCGGMQLLNVVLGGSLIQDIQTEVEGAKSHEQKHDRTQPMHPIDVKEGTLLAELLGKGQLMVNSTHHQAVKRLGDGLRASAVAPDGVVECVESTELPFAVGVQWHPELLLQTIPAHLSLYRGLVQKARDVRR
jgi:putative glutamine amidotransferase